MKKKRKRRSAAPIMIIMFIIMATIVGGGIFLYVNANKLMLPGEWSREIDITTYAVDEAGRYLAQATFGDEVEMKEYISDVKLSNVLMVTKEGEITSTVDKDSYEYALSMCKSGLETAVRDLIDRRIKENYIETDMTVDELIGETFSMSLSEYLNQYAPKLLPDYEEFETDYGMSATYVADKDSITISSEGAEDMVCNYAVSHGMLVIDYSDGAVVYYER